MKDSNSLEMLPLLTRLPVANNHYHAILPVSDNNDSEILAVSDNHDHDSNLSHQGSTGCWNKIVRVGNRLIFKEAARGFQVALTTLWPWVFYFTMVVDKIKYDALNENERFGTTAADILLGTANAQFVVSTHWGSDIPAEAAFIVSYATFLLFPPLMSLLWVLSHRNRRAGLSEEQYRADIASALRNLTDNSLFIRLRGIYSLSKIVNGIDKTTLNNSLLTIRESSLAKLKDLAETKGLAKLYANILLWQSGESKDLKTRVPLGIIYFFNLIVIIFAIGRYGEVIIFKSIAIDLFRNKKGACKESDGQWLYMPQIANYDCTVCGDWEFVYYKDMYSAQGCLDGLFHSTQDSTQINFERLAKFPDVTSIDLSKKAVWEWSQDYLKKVLDKLSSFKNLSNLNMSTVAENVLWRDDAVHTLKEFLAQKHFSNIDFTGQNLGANQAKVLLDNFTLNNAPSNVYLARNNLTDTGVPQVMATCAKLKVDTIDVSFNNAGPNGVIQVAEELPNSSFSNVYMQGTTFDQESFDVFGANATESKIKNIDLSHSDLGTIDVTAMGNGIPNSQINTVKMDQCGLTYVQVDALSPGFAASTKMHIFSVGNNRLTNRGGIDLIHATQNGTITTVNLSKNLLSDLFISENVNILPSLQIKHFDLSQNAFSVNALDNLIWNLPATLEIIDLSETKFNDQNAATLARFIQTKNNSLKILILNKTQVTYVGAKSICTASKGNSQIQAIYLRNTYLTNECADDFATLIRESKSLLILDLSDTYFDEEVGDKLVAAVESDDITLEEFYLDNVPLGDSVTCRLAKSLITPNKDIFYLNATSLSRDEKRALSHTQARTPLKALSLFNTNLTSIGARCICRVLPYTKIPMSQLDLHGNPDVTSDVETCAASSLKPWISFSSLFNVFGSVSKMVSNIFKQQNDFPSATPVHQLSNAIPSYHDLNSTIKSENFFSKKPIGDSQHLRQHHKYNAHPDINGTLFLLFLIYETLKERLPNFWPTRIQELSATDELKFDQLNNLISQLKKQFLAQAQSPLARSEIFSDKRNYCEAILNEAETKVKIILKHKKFNHSDLNDIKEKLDRVERFVHQHAQNKKSYKKVLLQEARAQRRYLKSGNQHTSVISRNSTTDELTHVIAPSTAEDRFNSVFYSKNWTPAFFNKIVSRCSDYLTPIENNSQPDFLSFESHSKLFNK